MLIDYEIQEYPYLIANKVTSIGCIRLDESRRTERTLDIDTEWKYYAVNSVAYPIYDNLNKLFIRESVYYNVIGNRISLSFFPLANPVLDDSIFAISLGALGMFLSTPQSYKLYVTLASDVNTNIGRYNQYINCEVLADAVKSACVLFNNVTDYNYLAKNASVSGINVVPQSVIFNPATQTLDVIDSGIGVSNDPSLSPTYLYHNKSGNRLNAMARFTNSDGSEVQIIPVENFTAPINYIAIGIFE